MNTSVLDRVGASVTRMDRRAWSLWLWHRPFVACLPLLVAGAAEVEHVLWPAWATRLLLVALWFTQLVFWSGWVSHRLVDRMGTACRHCEVDADLEDDESAGGAL